MDPAELFAWGVHQHVGDDLCQLLRFFGILLSVSLINVNKIRRKLYDSDRQVVGSWYKLRVVREEIFVAGQDPGEEKS